MMLMITAAALQMAQHMLLNICLPLPLVLSMVQVVPKVLLVLVSDQHTIDLMEPQGNVFTQKSLEPGNTGWVAK